MAACWDGIRLLRGIFGHPCLCLGMRRAVVFDLMCCSQENNRCGTNLDKMTNADLYKNTNSEPWSKTTLETSTKLGRPQIPTPRKHTSKTSPGWIPKENQMPSWATKTNVGGANLKRNRHKNSYTDNWQNCMENGSSERDGNLAEKHRQRRWLCSLILFEGSYFSTLYPWLSCVSWDETGWGRGLVFTPVKAAISDKSQPFLFWVCCDESKVVKVWSKQPLSKSTSLCTLVCLIAIFLLWVIE